MHKRIISIVLLMSGLLLAGFGCKPILDQRVQEQQEATSIWLKHDPKFRFERNADSTGTIYVSLQTQQGSTVTVLLEGPGVVRDPALRSDVDADGNVEFNWQFNRIGHYTYQGSIIFNRVVEEVFSGEGDVY